MAKRVSKPKGAAKGPAVRSDAFRRFVDSMVMDFDKWHDGVGYDLDALRQVTADERAELEQMLREKRPADWRDAEALKCIGSDGAVEGLRQALKSSDWDAKLAAARDLHDLNLLPEAGAVLARSFKHVKAYGGLTRALDWAMDFHPMEVVTALWEGAEERDGETAMHLAAMLMYLHGLTDEQFDWEHRPFLLTFVTENQRERTAAVTELRRRVGDRPVRSADAAEQ